jgi:hypothetical protein
VPTARPTASAPAAAATAAPSAPAAAAPAPKPKAAVPPEGAAVLAKMGQGGPLHQRIQGYVTEDDCLAKIADPSTLADMPEGAKFTYEAPNPPKSATINDPSIAGFERFALWVEKLARPTRGRLVFGRLTNNDTGAQVGWAAFCLEDVPLIRVADWRPLKSPEPGKTSLGITPEGLKRIAAASPTKETLVYLLDGKDITVVTPLAGLRANKDPVITFTIPVPSKP